MLSCALYIYALVFVENGAIGTTEGLVNPVKILLISKYRPSQRYDVNLCHAQSLAPVMSVVYVIDVRVEIKVKLDYSGLKRS